MVIIDSILRSRQPIQAVITEYHRLGGLRASHVAQWWGTRRPKREPRGARVQSLGGEDPPEEEMATHSSVLGWRTSGREESGGLSPQGCKELDTTEATWQTGRQVA